MTNLAWTQWLTPPKASRMLGVGWTSVILLIRSGQIDGRLVGGHRWFCTHDLVRRFLSRPLEGRAG